MVIKIFRLVSSHISILLVRLFYFISVYLTIFVQMFTGMIRILNILFKAVLKKISISLSFKIKI